MQQYQDGERRFGYVRRNGVWVADDGQDAAQPGQIRLGNPNPRLPYQTQQDAGQAAAAPYLAPKAAADARTAQAEAAYARQRAEAEARKAEAEAEVARLQAGGKTPQGQDATDTNNSRRALLDQVANAIRTTEGMYRSNYKDDGLLGKIQQSLPSWASPTNQAFDSAASRMASTAQGMIRVPGQGSQSDFEFAQFMKANQPSHMNFDETIEGKLQGMKDRVDSYRRSLGMEPVDWDEGKAAPGEKMDATRQTVGNSESRDQLSLSRGTKTIDDPVLRGVAAKVGSMLSGGASDKDILQFMQAQGVDPSTTSISQALQERRKPSFRKWQQLNPGKPYPVGKSFYQKEVPLSDTQNLVNNVAQSAYGTAAVAAGQAMTGNRLDDWSGNPEQARLGEQILRTEHPYSSFAGDIAGQAAIDAGLGRIPGVGRLLDSPWGRRAGDLAYGAYAGSGQNNGDPGVGAIEGALTNAAGGMAGRNVQRYAGKAVRGVRDEGLQYLIDRDIPVTVGEISRAAQNPLARAVGGIEDRMAGFPVVGDIINGARKRGSQGFNEAAFAEGGRPIGYAPPKGVVGATANEGFANATSDAYREALRGVSLKRDKAFDAQFASAVNYGAANPRHGPDFLSLVNDELKPLFNPDGTMGGENLQEAIGLLRKERAAYKGPGAGRMQKAITQVENALTGMVRRQAPRVMPALNAANEAYGNRRILGKAVEAAKNREDELITPAQLNNASVANARNYGGQDLAQSTNRPFYNLGTAGQKFLSNVIPDSGTAGRYVIPGAIGAVGSGVGFLGSEDGAGKQGASEGGAKGLALGLALTAPYSKTGQKILQKGLFGGNRKRVDAIEEMIRKNPALARVLLDPRYLGGYGGQAAARDAGLYPELPY